MPYEGTALPAGESKGISMPSFFVDLVLLSQYISVSLLMSHSLKLSSTVACMVTRRTPFENESSQETSTLHASTIYMSEHILLAFISYWVINTNESFYFKHDSKVKVEVMSVCKQTVGETIMPELTSVRPIFVDHVLIIRAQRVTKNGGHSKKRAYGGE